MLNRIEIKQKTGNEPLLFNGKEIGVKLIDFWSWGLSDIISNTARGSEILCIFANVGTKRFFKNQFLYSCRSKLE